MPAKELIEEGRYRGRCPAPGVTDTQTSRLREANRRVRFLEQGERGSTRDLLTAEGTLHIFYSQRIVNARASTARSGGTASVRTAALRTRSRAPADGAPMRMLNAAWRIARAADARRSRS
jgi:hypothetical protein